MHRANLLQSLDIYESFWIRGEASVGDPNQGWEQFTLNRIRSFVKSQQRCFDRELLEGHVTGSAFVVDKSLSYVLMTHHRKLDKWLQLGGHADGEPDVYKVAMAEAKEESGLTALSRVRFAKEPTPFDIDVHSIPARKEEPEHVHYDIRYLIMADKNEPLMMSDESNDLKWFTLSEARAVTSEWSMLRQFQKLELIQRLRQKKTRLDHSQEVNV